MWTERPDPVAMSLALLRAGLELRPDQLRPERHDERWLVRLPERRLGWFPASSAGERDLAVENRVLRLIRSRCSFQVPEIVFLDPAGEYTIRSLVGVQLDPFRLVADLKGNPALEVELAGQLGRILAEQHGRIRHEDVRGWLPESVKWPWSVERVLAGMEAAVPNRGELRSAAADVFARRAAVPLVTEDLALAHTDFGFHNMAFAEEPLRVIGLFDYDSAAWVDRHHDFTLLLYDGDRVDFLEAMMASYEMESGYTLSRERILLYNAAYAFTSLAAYRGEIGSAPDEKPCGRTLAEDVGWCEWAAENVLADRASKLFR